jgi:hypothetical protein
METLFSAIVILVLLCCISVIVMLVQRLKAVETEIHDMRRQFAAFSRRFNR